MLSDRVLDVQRYPTIVFQSTAISPTGPATGTMTLRVTGALTLRGVTQTVTVPVEVQLAQGRLTATGKVTVRQSAYGIRPVTAGAGTVKVKDDVDVVFTVAAGRP
jgi:polyisoprenoid-binding protein YceI